MPSQHKLGWSNEEPECQNYVQLGDVCVQELAKPYLIWDVPLPDGLFRKIYEFASTAYSRWGLTVKRGKGCRRI